MEIRYAKNNKMKIKGSQNPLSFFFLLYLSSFSSLFTLYYLTTIIIHSLYAVYLVSVRHTNTKLSVCIFDGKKNEKLGKQNVSKTHKIGHFLMFFKQFY